MWVGMGGFRGLGVGRFAECGWEWVDSVDYFFENTCFLLFYYSIQNAKCVDNQLFMKIRYKLGTSLPKWGILPSFSDQLGNLQKPISSLNIFSIFPLLDMPVLVLPHIVGL
jgi:hypothetical protein